MNSTYIYKNLMVCVGVAIAFCASATQDDIGNTIKPVESVSDVKVASVSNFGAEVALALGLQPIAVSDYPDGLPAYLEELKSATPLGPRSRTNFEALYDVNPDVIIGLGRMMESYYSRFADIAPTYGFDLITYQDSFRAVETSALALGQEKNGERLNKCFSNFIERTKQKIGSRSLTGVFLTGSGITPRAYYPHYMTVTLMEKLNIVAANGHSPYKAKMPFSGQINLEWLVKLDPDVIFIYKGTSPQSTKTKLWNSLQAVKNQRVFYVDKTWREPEGPLSRVWVTMDIAHKAYPDLFQAPSLSALREAICPL